MRHRTAPGFVSVVVLSAITAAALTLAGCAAPGTSLCAAAGGTYERGTCSAPSANEAVEAACERRGGMYLPGQNYCAFRGGGQ